MIGKIRNIHIENVFAAILQNHLFSFRYGILPSDVHFTLVFDEKLEDMNLHLTRNVGGKSKPQIKILVVNKKMLLENVEVFSSNILNTVLEPFDMQEFAERNNLTVGFLSFNEMESSEAGNTIVEEQKRTLQPHSKVRSKRLKISGDLNPSLEELFGSKKIIDLLDDQMKPVSFNNALPVEGGILLTETKHFHAIRIEKQWYFFRTDLSIFQLLRSLLDSKTAYCIICKTLDAIERVSTANTYEDTKPFNNPCRLELREITLPVINKLQQ